MLHRNLTSFQLAAIAALAFVGSAGLAAAPVPGLYQLSFLNDALQPVSTLPVCTPSVCEELILKAHVEEESSGNPAQGGLVVFQYCSRNGPSNDITRADEAPSAECEDPDNHSAKWARLATFPVNQSGDAFYNFGIVRIPRTVGFRFRYLRQGGDIASAVSDPPMDFIWVP